MDDLGAVELDAKTLEVDNELLKQAKHEASLVGNPVRPDGLALAINREMRRQEKKLRRQAQRQVAPIIVPRPLGIPTALDKVVDILVMQPAGMFRSTILTLAKHVDETSGRKLVQAYDKAEPLPRDIIRSALAEIHRRGEVARRKQRARVGLRPTG